MTLVRRAAGNAALLAALSAPGALVACKATGTSTTPDSGAASEPQVTSTAAVGASSVSGVRIAVAHAGTAGEWQMPAGDYASSRYSELASITPQNVGNLKVSWAFSTGVLRGHEGQPLVVGNTMYVVTPYPNVSYAIDLATAGQPLKWKFRPDNAQQAIGRACCDVVNRGAAYADGKIFYNLLDGHTIAIDAATGNQVWRTQMGDLSRGETITMAPIVVKGKVIVGSSGGEMGVRGWIAALDAATGKQIWRAYNIGPDQDVKVGPKFKPFYAHDRGASVRLTVMASREYLVRIVHRPSCRCRTARNSLPGFHSGNRSACATR